MDVKWNCGFGSTKWEGNAEHRSGWLSGRDEGRHELVGNGENGRIKWDEWILLENVVRVNNF